MTDQQPKKINLKLQEAFGHKPRWEEYKKDVKPAVDVDLSICTEEEKPRMISIINRLAKSEAGRETLEIAAKGGYKFGFLDPASLSFGCCWGCGYVTLNPMSTDDKLVGTLCHEARHAGQSLRDTNDELDRSVLNVESILVSSQAKEADAQTYAVLACEQLYRQGDQGPLSAFKKFYPPIAEAFEKAMLENENRLDNNFKTAVFKGWYDQDLTKTGYEENYILKPMNDGVTRMRQGKGEQYKFDQSVSCERVVEVVGWTAEGNYFTDKPEVLKEERFLSVGERTMSDMKEYFKIREELMGKPADHSIDTIPTHKDVRERRVPEMGKASEDNNALSAQMKEQDEATNRALRKWRDLERQNRQANAQNAVLLEAVQGKRSR